MSAICELGVLMADRGRHNYGEQITIAEHSLLTAAAAERHGEPDTLIAACLLHDVGHFLDEPDDAHGVHSHGDRGGDWAAHRFGLAVAEPVRMHVEAKRYLCAREPHYYDRLSPASQYTLTKQGGPMIEDEARQFVARPYAGDSLRLRRYEDDYGKRAGAQIPMLSHFAPLLKRLQVGEGRP